MATHIEGRLLSRSIPFLEKWISELTAPTVCASAPAAAPKAAKKAASPKSDAVEGTSMSACCFAVGRVVEVTPHPDSDKLYIEKIDMGPELNSTTQGEPRVILSGLQQFVKKEDFVNRLVLVIANLDPRKIAGISSAGMVLCASTPGAHDSPDREVVLLDIPEGAKVGERITFPGHEMPYAPVLKKKLAKKFEEVIAEVKTNADGVVCWKDIPFTTSAGVIKASMANAIIS